MPQNSSNWRSIVPGLSGDVLLAAIVDSSDDAIISKSLDGTIMSWNRAAERIYGYTADEVIGKSVLQLIPPELQKDEPEILARVARGERIEHFETERLRKDGTRVPVSLTISPIREDDGRIVGASKIARDLSMHRRAVETSGLLAAIVASSDDAIVSKNLSGVVTSWNKGAEQVFGYTAAEMVGRPIEVLFPPERIAEEPMILERLRRGERVEHFRTERVRKNGERVMVSVTISPIKDATGRVVGASKVARDITREQRAIDQLALANAELKRADEMKAEFLALMSHELRTPLNSIIGFAGVLRRELLTEGQKKQLDSIYSSGNHLLNLINDILDVSRIDAGRMDFDREEFPVEDVIREVVRALELAAAQKHIEVRYGVDGVDRVVTDRKRFYQVVLNLLNNAIKFTPSGRVDVAVSRDRDRLVVSVRDNGIGIPPDRVKDLFQPFTQLEKSSRRRFEGTGLGLYLCKRVVEMMGGKIGVRSNPAGGSEFHFSLPDAVAGNAENGALASASAS